ncbi:hypothetical protein L2E82_24754 [Cichorium intybus]|uniref:Uncharacterized protein n=1 Tax=Cichorium intybus TaxID=13427 RepID=A0ACB9E2D1_CICIN|nr:hypothetical protein L2E82_24754 [Cichorium intybus]
MWVNCERRYTSSTYRPAPCGSAACQLLNTTSCTTECYSAPAPGCYNNTCGHGPTNSVANTGTSGDLGADVLAIQSTDGKNVLKVVTVPRLYFVCGSNFIEAEGYGGTTISTADPYTVLESTIYSAVVTAFVKAMSKNVKRVPSVAPFGACFSSKNISSTLLGPAVPSIC